MPGSSEWMPRCRGCPNRGVAASVGLDYVHFSVLLDTARRFAAVTGVNIDGARLVKVPREDRWEFDERLSADLQAGPEVYADNDLDRGHLVRRNDPVWGSPDVAARANTDTFRFTNAAPQASGFNQSRELWLGLEDHVLEHARAHELKLSVFTGPVLADDDPPYRGIRIPLKFWKIAAWSTGDALATTGFVVDQSPLIDTDELPRELGAPPPLGPFRTFQVRDRRHRRADRSRHARARRGRAPASLGRGMAADHVARRHPGLTEASARGRPRQPPGVDRGVRRQVTRSSVRCQPVDPSGAIGARSSICSMPFRSVARTAT